MTGGDDGKKSKKKYHSRPYMLGVLFIAIGIFWYANAAGLLPEGLLANFWPVFFAGIGLWIIVKSVVKQKQYKSK